MDHGSKNKELIYTYIYLHNQERLQQYFLNSMIRFLSKYVRRSLETLQRRSCRLITRKYVRGFELFMNRGHLLIMCQHHGWFCQCSSDHGINVLDVDLRKQGMCWLWISGNRGCVRCQVRREEVAAGMVTASLDF
jgi:hypothetical protein